LNIVRTLQTSKPNIPQIGSRYGDGICAAQGTPDCRILILMNAPRIRLDNRNVITLDEV
jgi:hypothetical protein